MTSSDRINQALEWVKADDSYIDEYALADEARILADEVERLRVREAELVRDIERIRRWFHTRPWEGNPDPADHGGHPYTPRERELGYGTYRDSRFLPLALADSRDTPTGIPVETIRKET